MFVPNIRGPIPIHALHGPAESHRVGSREIPFRNRDVIDHAVIVEPIGVFGWDHRRWWLASPENWSFPAGIRLIPGNKQGGKRRVRLSAFGERENERRKKGYVFFLGKRESDWGQGAWEMGGSWLVAGGVGTRQRSPNIFLGLGFKPC